MVVSQIAIAPVSKNAQHGRTPECEVAAKGLTSGLQLLLRSSTKLVNLADVAFERVIQKGRDALLAGLLVQVRTSLSTAAASAASWKRRGGCEVWPLITRLRDNWQAVIAEFVGRALMIGLGVYFWLYVVRPNLPLVRGLSLSSWYGVRSGDALLRVGYAIVGTILIATGIAV